MSGSAEPRHAHRQVGARIACEWGPPGVEALLGADIAVVVDVLSFTTTLSVAMDAGAIVLPHPWTERAVGRGSLSPASMRRHAQSGQRIVLPSPNGSSLAHRVADSGVRCVGGCLRNASAIAAWVADQDVTRVAVIPAGERWPDGSLRPAVEDLWGAGAVISALEARGIGPLSVEARVAASAYHSIDDVPNDLHECASGRELVESGYGDDVGIAAEIDTSTAVPVLDGVAFTNVGS